MNRFLRVKTDKELTQAIIKTINEMGYKQVPDSTGGDHDFIMIDTLKKQWIWCEYGFNPFDSDYHMTNIEFESKDVSLYDLNKTRW